MMLHKRIPAQRSQAYTRWSPPDVAKGPVLRAEAAKRGERQEPQPQSSAQPWRSDSLEEQLLANIKAGRFASGISARQLEAIVRDSARDGRQDGYNRGFGKGQEEGFEQGRAEGLAHGRAIIEDAAGRLSGLIGALQQPLQTQQSELREAMLEIVTRIATAVVRSELRTHPDSIRQVVDEALAALPLGSDSIRLYVCEADYRLLGDYGGADREWALHLDPALEPGDCRIESRDSLVSYAVSDRLEAMIAQFFPGRRTPRNEAGETNA